jgi:D-glycero-alpha-D-manno-heptose-7-phosphate kinase
MRISFAGGGTDLAEFYLHEYGSVVAAAVDKYVYVIVKERLDNKVRASLTELEVVDRTSELRDELLKAAMEKVGITTGLEISVMSDIGIEFSDLGSSGSMAVGVLNALYAYKGQFASAEKLAKEACDIEIKALGRPGGKQNQYIAAYGGLQHFIFHPDESVGVINIELSVNHRNRLLDSLLLFHMDTTVQQDTIMQEQRRKTSRNTQTLITMRNQADDLAKYLKIGAVASLGQTLREGWMCKKTLASGISNSDIDKLVETAMSAGAIGAKVTGAGGGGFLLVCVPPEKRSSVRQKMSSLKELPINFSEYGSKIIFNAK